MDQLVSVLLAVAKHTDNSRVLWNVDWAKMVRLSMTHMTTFSHM